MGWPSARCRANRVSGMSGKDLEGLGRGHGHWVWEHGTSHLWPGRYIDSLYFVNTLLSYLHAQYGLWIQISGLKVEYLLLRVPMVKGHT